ncbi:hypothetical protein MK489_18155 [Myxococcota bacterium]|nr:hypothetical protein [Myxococcota bacterium]
MPIALGGAAVVISTFSLSRSGVLYDDAYIYFRYVDNLRGACPLAYNCADGPLEGFTSALYLAVLWLGSFGLANLPALSQMLGSGFLWLTLLGLAVSESRLKHWHGVDPKLVTLFAVAVLGLDPFFLINGVTGLETSLAALLVTLLYRAAQSESLAGLRRLVVLAVLARPECVLFALFIPVLPRARSPRYWVPLIVAGVCIALLRWLIFADVLPNTFWAKAGGTARHFELGVRYLGECVLDFPLVLAAPLALLHARPIAPVVYLLSVTVTWMLFFLRSGGDFFDFSRLFFPLVPVLTWLGVAALSASARDLLGHRRIAGWPSHVALLAALLVLIVVFNSQLHALRPMDHHPKHERWAQVGEFIATHHPGWSVATTPVGLIGHRSGAHIIDLVGLVSREVAHHGDVAPNFPNVGHEKYATDWVLEQRPDLIVTMDWSQAPIRPGSFPTRMTLGEADLARRIHAGRAPYLLYHPEVAPGLYWYMFIRKDRADQKVH